MASKKRDRTSDVLRALRKRGGIARIGSIALDLGIQPTTIYHHINPLLKNGTITVVKRGVIKLIRDPKNPTNLDSDNALDVLDEGKTDISEEIEDTEEVDEVIESTFPKRKMKNLVFPTGEDIVCRFMTLLNGYVAGVIELPEGTLILLYDTKVEEGLRDLIRDQQFIPSEEDTKSIRKLLKAVQRIN